MTPAAAGQSADGPGWLPAAVRHFVESAVVAGDLALPFHYPRVVELDGWQSGFRWHGITGESLVSSAPGAWQPGWYAIALNAFDDPFFIDLDDGQQDYPVYYAPLGAGRWDAQVAAPALRRFAEVLSDLRELSGDDGAAQRYLETNVGLTNALWREVHDGRGNRPAPDRDMVSHATPRDTQDWRHGTLILDDAGPQRVKVAQLLRPLLGVTVQEALAMSSRRGVALAEGNRVQLREAHDRLTALGATVRFVVQDQA